jgi:hypothetical protein
LLDLTSRIDAATRSLAPVHQLGVTVVSGHAAVGTVLRRLTAKLTARLTVALASVRLDRDPAFLLGGGWRELLPAPG